MCKRATTVAGIFYEDLTVDVNLSFKLSHHFVGFFNQLLTFVLICIYNWTII
jgi:hypothetical protein